MRQFHFIYLILILIVYIPLTTLGETSAFDPNSNTNNIESIMNELKEISPLISVDGVDKLLSNYGFEMDTILPPELVTKYFENGELKISSADDQISLGELLIQRNSETYLFSKAKIDAISLHKTHTSLEKKLLESYPKVELLNAKRNLENLKMRNPSKFNESLSKLKLPVNTKCSNENGSDCDISTQLISEAFKKNEIKLSNFKGLIGYGEPFYDYFEELKAAKEEEDRLAANRQKGITPTQDSEDLKKYKCTIDALKSYRQNIINVPKSFPRHVNIIGGSESKVGKKYGCKLVELSFDVQEKPFKRILKSGSITNQRGDTISLDQTKFDQVLRSWNIIPWNENSKILNKTDNLIHTQRNKFKPLPESQTKPDDGDGVR